MTPVKGLPRWELGLHLATTAALILWAIFAWKLAIAVLLVALLLALFYGSAVDDRLLGGQWRRFGKTFSSTVLILSLVMAAPLSSGIACDDDDTDCHAAGRQLPK